MCELGKREIETSRMRQDTDREGEREREADGNLLAFAISLEMWRIHYFYARYLSESIHSN